MYNTPSILVTGAAGYIGSVLVRMLLRSGRRVVGLDSLRFGGEPLIDIINHPRFRFLKGDFRDDNLLHLALDQVGTVIHLAALVGDKACKDHPQEAHEVMDEASKKLYHFALSHGARHFIFASTCSNYGKMDDDPDLFLNETVELSPLSHYASLKVGFEHFLQENTELPSTILRFATVYGASPRIRFDLSVNHFTRDLALNRDLVIFGASSWRPYCHVEDICTAISQVAIVGHARLAHQIYNVGSNPQNYTKRDLIDLIRKKIKGGRIAFQDSASQDPRNYRVDFSRIQKELGFEPDHSVQYGIDQILKLVSSGLLHDYDSIRYRNA